MTAIRETFEEVGILLCKNKDQLAKRELTSLAVENFDVKYWQAEVFRDANNFRKLCEELNVVPDLWSLHEWSVWLTPTWRRSKRLHFRINFLSFFFNKSLSYVLIRYETVFYVVGVNEKVNVNVKSDEVIDTSVGNRNTLNCQL